MQCCFSESVEKGKVAKKFKGIKACKIKLDQKQLQLGKE
jgi:hypothetical protein